MSSDQGLRTAVKRVSAIECKGRSPYQLLVAENKEALS